ncbi:MAG: hypothetical protein HFJ29_05455 [Clostridia bacterium]|nr:hypothetical protein [Clostridia bacterium]
MRMKEKNNFLSFLKMIFIDVDNTGEEIDIEKSEDPKMKELKESLKRVDALERDFYVSSSSPKGGKSNGIVETVTIDPKAVKAMAELSSQKQMQQKETEKGHGEIGE